MRFKLIWILPALLLAASSAPAWAQPAARPGQPQIQAAAAVVKDLDTGAVLYSKDSTRTRSPASITKVMTALLVLENGRLEQEVLISERAASIAGARIDLKPGERRTVRELLYAMMLASANDAALALAEHMSGSQEKFAKLMTDKARALGARGTSFINPHGLTESDSHFSTAEDISVIAGAAMARSDFREIVSTRRYAWRLTDGQGKQLITNSNNLLQEYPLAVGIKTGHTRKAGYCLAAAGRVGGRMVIAVVLGSRTREGSFSDAKVLLDWGLKEFSVKTVIKRGRRYGRLRVGNRSIPLVAAADAKGLAAAAARPRSEVRKTRRLGLPVFQGDKLGVVAVDLADGRRLQVDLVAGRSQAAPSLAQNVSGYFNRVVNKLLNLF